jgi:hypothetical protein
VIERRHVLHSLIVAILAVFACNEPRPPDEFLWEETFEEACGGVPCDWERVGGTPDEARYVETSLHPGEHGIALVGDGSIRGPGGEPMQVSFTFGTLEARIVGRCDAGAGIDLEVGIEQLDPLDGGSAFDNTMRATIFPPETWSEASRSIPITSASAFVDGGVGPPPSGLPPQIRITSVLLTMNGPGTCEIAEILIDATSTARRSLDDGC